MFRGIKWKLVFVFILIILAMMMIIGTVLNVQITNFYHSDFKQQMEIAFSDELISSLKSKSMNEDPVGSMFTELSAYSGRLGINSNRSFYILNKGFTVLASDDESETGTQFEMTDNLISALAGKRGDMINKNDEFLEYSLAVNDYIITVRDDKTELNRLTRAIFTIVLQALFIGILIAIIIGMFMARTITKPIEDLTKNAERLAEGDYDARIDIKADDEIGTLSLTFNEMASVITQSMTALSREKNKVETIIKYMNDGVLAFDTDGRMIHINPAAYELLGVDADAELNFDEYFEQFDIDLPLGSLIYLEYTKTIEREINVNGKQLNAFFAQFKIENDKTAGVVVVLHDVTEVMKMDTMRREFVANVSHELRTPLTTIRSYAETLLESDIPSPDQSEYFLRVINREVDRMTRIVKDLLTLSRLDSEDLHKDYFSLNDLILEVTEDMRMYAKEKHHNITYSSTTPLPKVYADKDRLQQVLVNIISNSVKYTHEGGRIEIFAGLIYSEIYIKIQDNGIGIPEESIPRVFERFYRVDKARSRDMGGTGLGLAIAQEIIQLHGGSIEVKSKVGKGTEVLIRLPYVTE